MKKSVFVFSLIFILFSCMLEITDTNATMSTSETSICEDIAGLADALDEFAGVFAMVSDIEEGGDLDQVIGDLVDSLIVVAETQNETALTNAVNNMTDAYNKMNAKKFRISLDRVIKVLDRIYRRDCS